ncbi:MAG: adenosylhomocysteinase, partial [Synergistes sp.]|nr:adenosylhomocysteinase [Synergistes sp.]
MNMNDASKVGDIFVTVTGDMKVIREEHFKNMKDGVLLANAGHFDVEVYLPDLRAIAVETYKPRDNIETFVTADGRRLHLLGEGRLVNLAAGDGHPVEIMDLSFALQLLSVIYVKNHSLERKLYGVPNELDRRIAELKLESLGITIEKLTREQEEYMASWRN